MQCSKCKQTISDDSRFCPECGVRFKQRPQIIQQEFYMGIKKCNSCGAEIPSDSNTF